MTDTPSEKVLVYGSLLTRFTGSPEGITGKFVQVSLFSDDFILMGRLDEYAYHAKLVERFCDANEIASYWVRSANLLKVTDLDCVVQGGGWFSMNNGDLTLDLYGHSTAYGGYDRNLMQQIFSVDSHWCKFSINNR